MTPCLPAGCTDITPFNHAHLRPRSVGKHWRCYYYGVPAVASHFGGRYGESIHARLQLAHINIIPLLAAVVIGGVPWEVITFAPGGDLRERFIINGGDPTASPVDALRAAADVAAGLNYMHGRHLVHMDVKPENCLIMTDGRVCLCDFEFTVPVGHLQRRLMGTPTFIAPEYRIAAAKRRLGGQVPLPVTATPWDIWSLGVLLWEVVHHQEAFADVDVSTDLTVLCHQLCIPPPITADFARSALALCLVPNPVQRASAAHIERQLRAQAQWLERGRTRAATQNVSQKCTKKT
jgi:serine/threonine protein kinase